MIYTLTLNTAVDMNIQCRELAPQVVNRTQGVNYFPNGKGVNVSIVLRHYNVPSRIIGFFGGFTGRYIMDELNSQGYDVCPIWLDEPTRINVFINDGRNEYKLVSPGARVNEQRQQQLLAQLNYLSPGDYLVISGSLPPGIDSGYYHQLLTLCQSRDIGVILDISAPVLAKLLVFRPLLIKPNDEEMREIFGFTVSTAAQARVAIARLHQLGARNVLLTMGAQGLYFSNGRSLFFCDAINVRVLSSACAGDAALAAFLSEWLYNGPVDQALKKAAATGANVAESEGLGTLSKVHNYIPQVNVKIIQ
ncbi:1-phosphofructokinase [Sodalis sp. RH21]|uniref:1-phosphofructokinase n=1 Tax=unclassified Sodalis (in: enterobacteria) TaxID=2636512 RepID=UPI0039B64975